MSYRCQVCHDHISHGIPQKRYVVYRRDRSIEREVPVCSACHADLLAGIELSHLIEQFRQHLPEQWFNKYVPSAASSALAADASYDPSKKEKPCPR